MHPQYPTSQPEYQAPSWRFPFLQAWSEAGLYVHFALVMHPSQITRQTQRWTQGLRAQTSSVLEEIYRQCFPPLLRYVRQNRGSEQDAEDTFQEALMVLYLQLQEGLELQGSFAAYLHRVAQYTWNNKRRKCRPDADLPPEDGVAAPDPSIDEQLQELEQRALYQEKFALLGQRCRELLNLFFARQSMQAIAQQLGLANAESAKQQKHKCKKRLIHMIEADPRYCEL